MSETINFAKNRGISIINKQKQQKIKWPNTVQEKSNKPCVFYKVCYTYICLEYMLYKIFNIFIYKQGKST